MLYSINFLTLIMRLFKFPKTNFSLFINGFSSSFSFWVVTVVFMDRGISQRMMHMKSVGNLAIFGVNFLSIFKPAVQNGLFKKMIHKKETSKHSHRRIRIDDKIP